MRSRPPCMAPNPRHSGVRRISGLIPDSTVQVRVGAHGSSSGPTHDPSPHDRLSSFFIHYTNIRGLNSNFSSVESHLATSSPNLFLLSETQLSSQSSPDPFQISHYNLYSRFRSKGGVCAYCNINTPIARLMDLESPHFDVLWLKITSLQLLSFFAFATAPLMLPTFPPSLSISLLAMSLCCLHTHMLKFSILETSMYTTLTGSNPPTLMLGELRRFISLFLMNWNKLSNILHVFLIVMTLQQTLLTYPLHLTLRTILTLSPLLWDPLTIVLFQLLQLLLHHHLSLPLSVIYGTLRTPGVLI